MRGFAEVTTEQELKAFEDVVDGFVDVILKEARVFNRGYVHKDSRSLDEGNGFDLQLLFQSQNRDYDIEVILSGAQSFQFDSSVLDDGMACSIEVGYPTQQVLFGNVYAARLFYRTHPKNGVGAFLGQELPSPEAIPAAILEPGWRQCSNCCDAWQETDEVQFSRCPSCASLTEVVDLQH
jgi:hypothetical protein